jgi:hypothetical protein
MNFINWKSTLLHWLRAIGWSLFQYSIRLLKFILKTSARLISDFHYIRIWKIYSGDTIKRTHSLSKKYETATIISATPSLSMSAITWWKQEREKCHLIAITTSYLHLWTKFIYCNALLLLGFRLTGVHKICESIFT